MKKEKERKQMKVKVFKYSETEDMACIHKRANLYALTIFDVLTEAGPKMPKLARSLGRGFRKDFARINSKMSTYHLENGHDGLFVAWCERMKMIIRVLGELENMIDNSEEYTFPGKIANRLGVLEAFKAGAKETLALNGIKISQKERSNLENKKEGSKKGLGR